MTTWPEVAYSAGLAGMETPSQADKKQMELLNSYYAHARVELERLRTQNAKLRKCVAVLLIAGTAQWLLWIFA